MWYCLGAFYYSLEGLFNIFKLNNGFASGYMILIGGVCGLAVGGINQLPLLYKSKIIIQSLIGTLIVLTVELLSGLVFNVLLGCNLWDYSHLRFNILGQICPQFAIVWFFLMPLAIWLEDRLQYYILLNEQYKNQIIIPETLAEFDYSL